MKTPTEEQIRFIAYKYPQAQGNNTQMCIGFWKETCKQRGIPWDGRLDNVILEYKPESIVRKRRDIFPATDEQREREEEYRSEYANQSL